MSTSENLDTEAFYQTKISVHIDSICSLLHAERLEYSSGVRCRKLLYSP